MFTLGIFVFTVAEKKNPQRLWKLAAGGGFFSEGKKCGEEFLGANEVDEGQYNTPKKIAYVYEAALVARMTLFEVIGLFDPLWVFNYEGPDICKRASKVGLESWYVPQASVEHEVNASFERSNANLSPLEMVTRTLAKSKNRFRFLLKHYPLNEALKIQEQYVFTSIASILSYPNDAFRELYSTFWNLLNLPITLSFYGSKRENYETAYIDLLNTCKITEIDVLSAKKI